MTINKRRKFIVSYVHKPRDIYFICMRSVSQRQAYFRGLYIHIA